MISIDNFGWRIGNQLFQIAAAIGLARAYNDEVYYPNNWHYARYFKHNFYNDPFLSPIKTSAYSEPSFAYSKIPYKKDMSINGYFQSVRYFEHCQRYIKQVFTLNPVNTEIEIVPNACFIHVRRGDYKNLPSHHPLATWDNYYKKAVDKIDVFFPSKYYIFSDEIALIKSEFPDNPMFEYIDSGDEITDFYLMTKCQYHIIGNSSYSWWSAYLSEYLDTKTVAPKNWFGTSYSQHDTKDLYIKDWIVV